MLDLVGLGIGIFSGFLVVVSFAKRADEVLFGIVVLRDAVFELVLDVTKLTFVEPTRGGRHSLLDHRLALAVDYAFSHLVQFEFISARPVGVSEGLNFRSNIVFVLTEHLQNSLSLIFVQVDVELIQLLLERVQGLRLLVVRLRDDACSTNIFILTV